ncbi:GspE/PulE family protein [Pseudomonadota bacterium]
MALPDALRQILTNSGYITDEQYDSALKASQDLDKPITDILLFRGLITEEALGKLVADYYQVPYISLKNQTIPYEILSLIPEKTAIAFHMVPFSKKEDQLYIAMEDPHDIEALEFAKRSSKLNIIPYYTTPADIEKAISQYKKNIKAEFKKIIQENIAQAQADKPTTDVSKIELPVTHILDTLLEYAFAESASDIHIEALEKEDVVRFRIDGILQDMLTLPKQIHPAIVARIKILSSLKIDEHRSPQDGRFKFKIEDNFIALRVSILPAFYGENVVLRLLAESARPLSLEELGFGGKSLELVRNNIKNPHGMILVTGPTGSGKTTTLYSILNMLNTPEVKITTIEDPVEYGIRRVNQVQVNAATKLTFAAGLRSLLRHDPDIIMIGEIRDGETAEIAIHSALTGHLVLSTLHTNNASGTIPRFLDMGAQGFLVASTINLVIAQRLVRRICSSCITKYNPDSKILETLEQALGHPITVENFYKGQGCNECGMTGYKGRVGIYELMEIDNTMRNLIIKQASAKEIEEAAIKNGMTRLIEDGINKAASGVTTIEEALRVMRE